MQISVGEIVEGTVSKITQYGAFIDLPDGKKGLVHISEIADAYVKNINDYLKERQMIKVKVLNITGNGRKIDLSIKQAFGDNRKKQLNINDGKKPEEFHSIIKPKRDVSANGINKEFEEKLTRFLKSSEERLADLKRNIEAKRGGNNRFTR